MKKKILQFGGFIKKWDHTGESVLRGLHQRLAISEALL